MVKVSLMNDFADNFAVLGMVVGFGLVAGAIVALMTSRRVRDYFRS